MLSTRSRSSWPGPLRLAALAIALLSSVARAQCSTEWLANNIAGTSGGLNAAVWWDRDGAGPLTPVLVVGGDFVAAGSVAAAKIALFDPATNQWQPLGSGMDAHVLALAVLPNGNLVAGGAFTIAGGGAANHVATWDGTTWSALGAGVDSYVHALACTPNGDIFAGGLFTSAGGSPANYVARWDGSAWSALGSGVTPFGVGAAPVSCLLALPNGDVIAGGRFTQAGGGPASCIARWDGSSWWPLGTGITPFSPFALFPPVGALALLPNGDLVAGGQFNSAGGLPAANVARWNGAAWSALGAGVPATIVRAVTADAAGDVYAGTVSSAGPQRWNGASWSSLGLLSTNVNALAIAPTGALVAAGSFAQPGSNVASWNGAIWSALGTNSPSGAPSGLLAVAERANGDVIAGGSAGTVALWNGIAWSSIGGVFWPPSMAYPQINAVAGLSNGDVVAGGIFISANGAAGTNAIARWNGSWQSLGGGAGGNASLRALVPSADGVIAVGIFPSMGGVASANIARWNGVTWSGFGAGIPGGVYAAAVLQNGDVIAGGNFTTAGGIAANNIARWNGTAWSALGAGVGGDVHALCALPNGDVIAGGHFDTAGGALASRIARWNGSTWSPLGLGMGTTAPGFLYYDVTALVTLPDGDVLAAGDFDLADGALVGYVARWNGSTWSAVDGGLAAGTVDGLVLRRNGEVIAVGSFDLAGGAPSPDIAILQSTCPATVNVSGSGCTGSGGPNVLTANTLPWTGSTFRATATGMPASGFGVAVFGFGALSVPLISLLAPALPGCNLLATPTVLQAHVLGGSGALATALAVPDSMALAGITLFEQVVALATDAAGTLTQATSTNALQFVVGTL